MRNPGTHHKPFTGGGATQELLMAGNSLEVIKGAWGWWGSGFRIYVDLEMDQASRIPRALIELIDSDSSDRGWPSPEGGGGP